MKQAAYSSETSVDFQLPVPRYIPVDRNLHSYRFESHRFYIQVNVLVKYGLVKFCSTKINPELVIHAKSTSDVIKQVVSRSREANREDGV
jgi:hypothetical protein